MGCEKDRMREGREEWLWSRLVCSTVHIGVRGKREILLCICFQKVLKKRERSIVGHSALHLSTTFGSIRGAYGILSMRRKGMVLFQSPLRSATNGETRRRSTFAGTRERKREGVRERENDTTTPFCRAVKTPFCRAVKRLVFDGTACAKYHGTVKAYFRRHKREEERGSERKRERPGLKQPRVGREKDRASSNPAPTLFIVGTPSRETAWQYRGNPLSAAYTAAAAGPTGHGD